MCNGFERATSCQTFAGKMALSKSTNTYNRLNWEQSEFPLLCQTCLGDNPYLRMLKDNFGAECKICERPFTIFRWCPGARMRYKKTEICQICARLKNVCQTCLFDLEYGLPVQVRDHAEGAKDNLPQSDVNKEYFIQNAEKSLSETGTNDAITGGTGGKAKPPNDMLMKLARTTPYYKRNRPHLCSFWAKGECKRGEECPFRHEMPTDPTDPLSNQNMKDRYYGINDPVAEKLLRLSNQLPKLTAPDDKSITSLYVGGVEHDITEKDLRDHFYQFGELRNINMVPRQQCAFVNFTTRDAAEKAAAASFDKLIIQGHRLKILWGRSQSTEAAPGDPGGAKLSNVPGLPEPLPVFDPFNLPKDNPPPPPPSQPPPPMAGGVHLPPPPPPPGAPPDHGYYPPPPPPPPGGSWGAPPPPPPGNAGPRQIYYQSQDPYYRGSPLFRPKAP